MHKKLQHKPRLVEVRDRLGDELPLPRLAQELVDADRAAVREAARTTTVREDLQAARRRPLDAPMATREPEPWADKTDYRIDTVVARFGARWAVLTLLCMAGSFVVGFFTGRAV